MLFGSSGIRRSFGKELAGLSLPLGSALGRSGSEILVGRDTRTTGPLLESLLSAGILQSGANVFQAGIAPTPAIAYNTRRFNSGVMITASHNPEHDNGFKLFRPDGSSFSGPDQVRVQEDLSRSDGGSWNRQGIITGFDALSPYIRAITAGIKLVPGIKMVLDCGNGAGCTATPRLFEQLGVHTVGINANPQGHFARPSEPLEEHLSYLPTLIRKTGSDGAIVHDGDADRMMAFDERGRFISGDQMMMLFIRYLGIKRVVTTFDASMVVEELAEVRRTPVGDTYVSDELTRWGEFGGEPSGAWIFPNHSLCPDGPYAAALFCEIASEWDLAEELDAMPSYPVIRKSFPCENATAILSALGAGSPTDGIRISGNDGWFLIRASGTEPKIRITAEGRDRLSAHRVFDDAVKFLREWKTA
jgi:phosphoglucosamine mutase